jgi:ParB-like chromosome segregation protein Spo0J
MTTKKKPPSMTIVEFDIDKIRPYENNPRKNAPAISKVKASLREFGWRQPIVVDSDHVIVVGDTRWRAAKQMGMKTVPVHVADLTPAQAKAYRLADNRTGEEADWDPELLRVELEDLGKTFDLELTAFDTRELEKVLDVESTGLGAKLADMKFQVLIDCTDEEHQRVLLEELEEGGLKCRALTL